MPNPTTSLPTLERVMKFLEAKISHSDHIENKHTIESKPLTRNTFFDAAYWAILVSNMSYDVAKVWQEKAKSTGFPDNWRVLADWDDNKFNKWCRTMARELEKPRKDLVGKFRNRWWAIWDIAWWLAEFESEKDFCEQVFNGKQIGAELNDEDVRRLIELKKTGRLFMIGQANRYFILRNLGGDFLKPDVWVQKFCEWYGDITVSELACLLRNNVISCGKFDVYLWSYCADEIRESHLLGARFDELFMEDDEVIMSPSKAVSVETLETSIWDREGIRVIVRAPHNTQMLNGYRYARAAKDSWRLSQFITERIEPILDGYEISVVDGHGLSPHRKTLLSTVRASYET